MKLLTKRFMQAGLGATVALSMMPAAFAQEADASSEPVSRTAMENVTVTGTKREADSQSVPISVSAITEQAIANTFRTDILAIGDLAPNVTLAQVAGFRAVAGGIRGTGQNSILVTQDSSVVILVDDFAYTRVQSQFVPLFDVERVEVYRGPQGTLFGKSATGGAISIVTKRPVMNERTADVEFQFGKFNSGSKGKIGKGRLALNIPVVEDKFAMRITALYDYDAGYYRNDRPAGLFPGVVPFNVNIGVPVVNPPYGPDVNTKAVGDGERLNGTDVFAGTIKGLWTPTDNYEALFIFRMLRDRSDSPPGVNESPALGELDQGVAQFMLLPLLGFPGIGTSPGPDAPYSTGVDNSCWHARAFCIPNGHRVNVEEYHLNQKLELDTVDLQLLIGYRDHEEILPSTYTGEAFRSLFDASRNTQEEQFQIELKASTNFDGPFNFVSGVQYQTHDVDMLAYATVGLSSLITPGPDGFGPDEDGFLTVDSRTLQGDFSMSGASQKRDTWAFYADGTFDVTDKFRITGGLRYTDDSKDFFRRTNPGGPCTSGTNDIDERPTEIDGEIVCLDARSNAISRATAQGFQLSDLDPFNLPLPDESFDIALKTSDSWSKTTWRAVLEYDLDDDSMVYLSYATGFIPGGFTETCSSLETCVTFESETNWNVEGGIKARWADGTVQTNLSMFYTRYSNLIRSQVVPFTDKFGVTTQETININAGSSEVFGIEFEGIWTPTENLKLDLSIGYMDHKYVEFELDGNDLSDLTVPFSPKWNIMAGVTYDWYLGNGGTLTGNTTVNYQSEAEFSVFNSLYTQLSARTLWDANLTWRDANQSYRVTLFMKNILDEKYRTAANSVAGLWNFTMWGRPQEWGVDVGFYF
jgi:iron complex outermembrane receptor protein